MRQLLDKVISSRNPNHAYLFFGPPSSEKESRAFEFIKALLCKKKSLVDDLPCGECLSCRKLDSGNHPDFRAVGADEEKIKIDHIRALKEESRYAPLESDWKIYYLARAERLTLEAAQSMLKILEEPPPYLVFVLTALHPHSVLPTIASRCQRVPFQARPPSEIAERLTHEKFPDDIASLLSHLDIAPEEAKEWNALATEAAPILFAEMKQSMDLFEQGGALEDYKGEGEKLLHLLLALYRDAAVLKAGWGEGVLFPKFKTRSEALSKNLSWETLREKSQMILDAQNHLRHNGNFRLVMENLLWKLRG